MKLLSQPNSRGKRSLQPVAWGALPVLGLAVGVVASGIGIDLLVVAVACLLLLTLDRTVGDWLAETIGSGPGALLFGLAALGSTWYLVSYPADDFFAAAEERGYHTAYYQRTRTPDSPAGSGAGAGAAVSSAAEPMSVGSVGSDTPAVRIEEQTTDDESRSKSDSSSEKTPEQGVTRSPGVPPSKALSSGASSTGTVSRILSGMLGKAPAPTPSRINLTISPAQVPIARRAAFQAAVTAEGRPLTQGTVDFTVNGVAVGKALLNSTGAATITFANHIPGDYEVQARFSGTSRHEPSSSEVQTLRIKER